METQGVNDKQDTAKPEVKPFKGTLTAKMLSKELGGTFQERMNSEKSISVHMSAGSKPEVAFLGFWNGRLVRAAMDSIAKAYRLRRHHITYQAKVGKKKEEKSDDK